MTTKLRNDYNTAGIPVFVVKDKRKQTAARSKQLKNARDNAAKLKRSKTHCVHGHEYTPENTIWKRSKWRNCRTCTNDAKFYANLNKKLERLVTQHDKPL